LKNPVQINFEVYTTKPTRFDNPPVEMKLNNPVEMKLNNDVLCHKPTSTINWADIDKSLEVTRNLDSQVEKVKSQLLAMDKINTSFEELDGKDIFKEVFVDTSPFKIYRTHQILR
jgi:hypothetical protein